jgi:hypothetical protein
MESPGRWCLTKPEAEKGGSVLAWNTQIHIYWLVVLTILNNMKVNGKDYPIYYGK